jgi:hypothetical protein
MAEVMAFGCIEADQFCINKRNDITTFHLGMVRHFNRAMVGVLCAYGADVLYVCIRKHEVLAAGLVWGKLGSDHDNERENSWYG